MASLTLKNLPEGLLRSLRKAAEKDRRSLTQEVIYLLDTSLRRAGRSADAEVETQVAAWRKLAGRWESDADRATEADQLMDQRTQGRDVDL
jgi:plasmid stability protein